MRLFRRRKWLLVRLPDDADAESRVALSLAQEQKQKQAASSSKQQPAAAAASSKSAATDAAAVELHQGGTNDVKVKGETGLNMRERYSSRGSYWKGGWLIVKAEKRL